MNTKSKMALTLLVGFALGAVAIQALHAQAKPPAYVVTEVQIIDEAAFKEFAPKTDATMAPFGGKRLVRGGKIIPLEGDPPKRFVITMFDSAEKAQAWRDSPGWKALLPIRDKAVKSREFIVEGISH
jgi:uncharacterized protein (DUF1330 family)